jgi:hypothetical protein
MTETIKRRSLMDAAVPIESDSSERTGVIRNKDWHPAGSITFWPSLTHIPQVVYQTKFPAWVGDKDSGEYVRTYNSFPSPDQIDPVTAIDLHRAQSRLKADKGHRYWFSRKTETGLAAQYHTVDPVWCLMHYLRDKIRDGELSGEEVVFAWTWMQAAKGSNNRTEYNLELPSGKFCGAIPLVDDEWKTYGFKPKGSGLLLVVDENDPGAGAQFLITPASIAGGDPPKDMRVYKPITALNYGKLFTTISNNMNAVKAANELLKGKGKSKGIKDPDDCDPWTNPHPLQLHYDSSAKTPADKYRIQTLLPEFLSDVYELTDAIREGIEAPIPMDALRYHTTPHDGACEELYENMRRASNDANFELPLDELFAPWRKRLGTEGGTVPSQSADKDTLVCDCGLVLDPNWNECPNCAATLDGNQSPPSLDEIVHAGSHKQVCTDCCHHALLTAVTCPKCDSELQIQPYNDDELESDGFDDLDDLGDV